MRAFCAVFTATTASTMRLELPASWAMRIIAMGVLGKAGSAIARSRVQKLFANARVQPHTPGHRVYIGTGLFAQLRDFIDKADFCRQEGVGCVLGDLGAFQVGDQDGRLDQVERAVQFTQQGLGALALHTQHHAVGAHEIVDGGALAQKFGIGGDIEVGLRIGLVV